MRFHLQRRGWRHAGGNEDCRGLFRVAKTDSASTRRYLKTKAATCHTDWQAPVRSASITRNLSRGKPNPCGLRHERLEGL